MFSNRDPLCLPSSPTKMAYKPKIVTSLPYFSRTFHHYVLLLSFGQFIEHPNGWADQRFPTVSPWRANLLGISSADHTITIPGQIYNTEMLITVKITTPWDLSHRSYNLPFTWEQNLKLNEETRLAFTYHPPLPGNLLANTCLAHCVAYAKLLLQGGRPGRRSRLPKMFLPLPVLTYFFQSICLHVTLIFPWSRDPELCEVRHTSSHCCGPSVKNRTQQVASIYQMSHSSQHNVTFPYLILIIY